jgi:hypothetical protein
MHDLYIHFLHQLHGMAFFLDTFTSSDSKMSTEDILHGLFLYLDWK